MQKQFMLIGKLTVLSICLGLGAGCMHGAGKDAVMARASLIDAQGRPSGMASIGQGTAGLTMIVEPMGLSAGTYAMHLHQTGKCDTPDFTTAGPHWNPAGRQHGLANTNGPHAGDFPNIVVTTAAKTTISVPLGNSVLSDGNQSLLDHDGAALIIHAKPDDNLTDPSGNSGSRILCGVLKEAAN